MRLSHEQRAQELLKDLQLPIHKGCRRGAPESPVLWNLVLDEATGETLRSWQARQMGARLPNLAGAGDVGTRNKADVAERMNHLAFADDLLLLSKIAAEVKTMSEDMMDACGKWGVTIRAVKLRLWCIRKRPGWQKLYGSSQVYHAWMPHSRCHMVALGEALDAHKSMRASEWRHAWWHKTVRGVLHRDADVGRQCLNRGLVPWQKAMGRSLQKHTDLEAEQPWQLTAQNRELQNHLAKSFVARVLRKRTPQT